MVIEAKLEEVLVAKNVAAMFHVKPLLHKAFDIKELRAFCIK